MQTLWAMCFFVLLLLAALDFFMLWKSSRKGAPAGVGFSSFTLASQGAFAVFAAFYIAPQAFEDFSSSKAIQYAELIFLGLMAIGAVADRSKRKTSD